MNKKILVCDDDEGILTMVSTVLGLYNFDVIPEINSVNAMQQVVSEKPDAVLVDLWMPLVSGEDVIRQIKENPDTQGIPVILFSASSEGKEIAAQLNVNGFVSKPFDLDTLVNTINGVL